MKTQDLAVAPINPINTTSEKILTVGRLPFIIAIMGTVVEYYDYALYGFAASILANHFFPETDSTVALLQVFGIFAAGSLAKPLGSLVFGWIGDKFGRRICLRITMIGIIIPTTIVALIPGYEQLGWLAPLILLCCRFAQGFFVSGESDGVRLFIFESTPKKSLCFGNSLIGLACYIGIYIASSAITLVQSIDGPSWLWRIPFVAGGLLGVAVITARQYLCESIEFQENQSNPPASILKKEILLGILTTVLWCGAVGGTYHIFFVFMPSYLCKILQICSATESGVLNNISLLIYVPTLLLAGLIADRYDINRQLKISLFLTFMMMGIILYFFQSFEMLKVLFPITAFFMAFFHAPGFVLLMKQFSVKIRYRSISLGHSIGSMLFSGSAPVISTWLWHKTNFSTAPLFYFIGLLILGRIALILIPDQQ